MCEFQPGTGPYRSLECGIVAPTVEEGCFILCCVIFGAIPDPTQRTREVIYNLYSLFPSLKDCSHAHVEHRCNEAAFRSRNVHLSLDLWVRRALACGRCCFESWAACLWKT